MTSVDPLRMYLFEEGLVRFSTHKYTLRNLKCRYAHLTNYSLNKKSRHFVSNDDPEKDDVGSKWSLRALWDYLAKKGEDVRKVRREIASVLVKTLIAAESEITPITHRAFAAKTEYNHCFELFGFDVLLDAHLKPWLIEVNVSPSLMGSSPLDKRIKGELAASHALLRG